MATKVLGERLQQSPPRPSDWTDKLGIKKRFARLPIYALIRVLNDLEEPRIRLRARKKNIEIVIKPHREFTSWAVQVHRWLKSQEASLPKAFEAALSQSAFGADTIRSELTNVIREAYRESWFRFLRLAYRGHSHSSVDKYHERVEEFIRSQLDARPRGRKRTTRRESTNLRRRYLELLSTSNTLHAASVAASKKFTNNFDLIREEIWNAVHKDIERMTIVGHIFGALR
jgi:hypothetical protein